MNKMNDKEALSGCMFGIDAMFMCFQSCTMLAFQCWKWPSHGGEYKSHPCMRVFSSSEKVAGWTQRLGQLRIRYSAVSGCCGVFGSHASL
jgi:hypothetical protein